MVRKPPHRTFWLRVKEALHDKGWPETQKYAAQIAHVKQPSVSDWNKPGKTPELDTAVDLALQLGVCVEWLYTERGPKHPGPPGDKVAQQLWSMWGDLSDDGKRDLLGFARGLQMRDDPTATLPNTRAPAPSPKAPTLRAAKGP